MVSDSAIFNISPKAARVEVVDIPHKRRITMDLGLNVEGFDAVLLGTQLFVVGGLNEHKVCVKSCFSFNLANAGGAPKKEVKADLQTERMAHTVQDVLKKFIYCVGGYNPTQKYLKLCEKYVCPLNKWVSLPSMNEHKSQASLCLMESRLLYVIGGCLGPAKWLRSVEILNLEKEHFGWGAVKIDGDWEGSYCSGCLAVTDTEILIFGGNRQNKLSKCYIFDRFSIQECENSLESPASFYQRKPRYSAGFIYAPCTLNEIHIGCNPPSCTWYLQKISDFSSYNYS